MGNIRRRIVGVMFPASISEDRSVDFRRSINNTTTNNNNNNNPEPKRRTARKQYCTNSESKKRASRKQYNNHPGRNKLGCMPHVNAGLSTVTVYVLKNELSMSRSLM